MQENQEWTDQEILEGLEAFYQTVDRVLTDVGNRLNPPCRRGCSHCCKDVPPPASPSEWKRMLASLRELPAEQRQRMLHRARELGRQNAETLDALQAEPERFDELAKTLSYVCPFLENEACSIYQGRPLACRLYGLSYVPSHDKMYACHLVEEALLGETAHLANLEALVQMLRLYPGTESNQIFPWYALHDLPADLEEELAEDESGTSNA